MILSTARRRRRRFALQRTPQIEGHTIREYKGIVTGETIIAHGSHQRNGCCNLIMKHLKKLGAASHNSDAAPFIYCVFYSPS